MDNVTKIFMPGSNERSAPLDISRLSLQEKMIHSHDHLTDKDKKDIEERFNRNTEYLSNDLQELLEYLGDELPKPYGPQLLIKPYSFEEHYINIEGNNTGIYLPETVRKESSHTAIVGLLLAKGSACFKGESFKYWDDCEIGKWVAFAPHVGTTMRCKGVPLRFIYDDKALGEVPNPAHVSRT